MKAFGTKKSVANYIISCILAIVTVSVVFVLGNVWLGDKENPLSPYWEPVFLISLFLWIACVLWNVVAPVFLKKKFRDLTAERINEMFIANRQQAKEHLGRETRRVILSAYGCLAYMIFFFVLTLATAFFSGAHSDLAGIAILFVFIIWGIYQRWLSPLFQEPPYPSQAVLDRAEYPILYGVADRAKAALGLTGHIEILPTGDFTASILGVRGGYGLLLGSALVASLDEEEMYNTLLHEFAHYDPRYTPKRVPNALRTLLETPEDIGRFGDWFISYFLLVYQIRDMFYQTAASQYIEKGADAAVKDHGSPVKMAAVLAKCSLYDRFANDAGYYIGTPYYAPETDRTDRATHYYRAFRETILQRLDRWLPDLEKELQPRNSSHPIFRLRRESIGVAAQDVVVRFPDEETPFSQEGRQLLANMDHAIYENSVDTWGQEREEEYLYPLSIVKKWEFSPHAYMGEESIPVIEALCTLCRYEEAEALCDEIVATADTPYKSAYALLRKAMFMALRDEDDCIPLFYRVMDLNNNYTDVCMEQLGNYCCRRGLEEELEAYRSCALVEVQRMHDEGEPFEEILPRDHLVKDDLDPAVLEEHLAFFKEVGGEDLVSVHIVKKVASPTLEGHLVVIQLEENTSDERKKEIMGRVFRRLDTCDNRQWGLFYWTPQIEYILKKVKGSLLYQKNK